MCETQTLVPIPEWADASTFDADHPEYGIDADGRKCFAIDTCIVPALLAVWAAGYRTLGCCCGHGQVSGGVISGIMTLDTGAPGYRGPRTETQRQMGRVHSAAIGA